MLAISKTFEWDMGHRVTNHDSICKNLHGHRYKMIVTITGPLNDRQGESQQGMVLDFGFLKKIITSHVVDKFDHSFMYWEQDELLSSVAGQNKHLKMHAVAFVPTAECIASYFATELNAVFAKEIPEITLTLLEIFETPTSRAIWSAAK